MSQHQRPEGRNFHPIIAALLIEVAKSPSEHAEGVEGEDVLLPGRLEGLGSVVSSRSGVRDEAPAENDFTEI